MKKLFATLAIFTLILSVCTQAPDNDSKLPKLTIRNQSSYDLANVKFEGITFESESRPNELPRNESSSKELTENHINNSGYITVTRNDIGIDCKTQVITISSADFVFTFHDSTVVEEIANSSNKNSLSQITFVSKISVERNGLTVEKGELLPLGETVVNIPSQFNFTLKNTGVGKLLFTGTQPVKISGAEEGVFTVVQPTSSEIASNASLTFRINFNPNEIKNYTGQVTISSNDLSGDFTFTISARGIAPKPIAKVFFEDAEIPQNGTIPVGGVLLTQSKNISVVIKNTGTDVLTIDTANISITGANADAFIRTTKPGVNISVDSESSFFIECKPTEQGVNDAILTIPTNDDSRNPIVVFLRMTAAKGSAVLELWQADTVIANNSLAAFDFRQVDLGSNKPLVFMIKNAGNIALELTGTPAVESSNAVFTIPTQPSSKTIAPGIEVPFLLQYNPTVETEENAVITIYTNSDDMVFTFSVKGTGYVKRPQITVKQDNSTINQDGEYDFGSVALGENKDIAFDIENIGDANLNIITVNGSRINLEDNTDGLFSVIQQPSTIVTPENTTNFVLRFSPTAEENNFTATVHIKTDSQNNDEFYFLVKGNGYIKRPQITIIQGPTTYSPNVTYSFGTIFYTTTKTNTLTIRNSGEAVLTFSMVDGKIVNLEDNAGGHFSVSQPSIATLNPGNTTTFNIIFNPANEGSFTATVRIVTNSQYNADFSFRVTGTGRDYYIIGDTGPAGGIIFYDAGSVINGWRYLEASLTDFNAQWGRYFVGGTGLSIGDGKQNTQRIVAFLNSMGETGRAAQVCANLNLNGFTDWFLPSRNELNLMYERRNMISGFSTATTPTNASYYWSSSESGDENSIYRYNATAQRFSDGNQRSQEKDITLLVRAIRAF